MRNDKESDDVGFDDDIQEEDGEIDHFSEEPVDDDDMEISRSSAKPANNTNTLVNMASVIPNPKIVNNQAWTVAK